jgi:hypothetical protein
MNIPICLKGEGGPRITNGIKNIDRKMSSRKGIKKARLKVGS